LNRKCSEQTKEKNVVELLEEITFIEPGFLEWENLQVTTSSR